MDPQDLFLEIGFNDGKPIDDEFFRTKIAGRQNAIICAELFPDWDVKKAEEWSAYKEAKFRESAVGKLTAMPGLERFMAWIDENNLEKAAVTNAPRANAEFMLEVINRRSPAAVERVHPPISCT
jgi:beta-phosphoglucomutase-like phosphatase (HAD superfamily)